MKKIILIAMLAVAGFANAQKGTYLVMGSIGFSSQKQTYSATENKGTGFSISPKVGYQFTDHWTLGFQGGYNHNKTESNPGNNENTTNAYTLGVFARYGQPINEMFEVYADISTGYSHTENSNNLGAENTSNGFGIGVLPALRLNIKNNYALNFGFGGLNYGTSKDKDAGTKNSGLDFTFGNTFTLGLSKNF